MAVNQTGASTGGYVSLDPGTPAQAVRCPPPRRRSRPSWPALAKAGIVSLTCVMGLELRRFGIQVSALAPVGRPDMTAVFENGAVTHQLPFPATGIVGTAARFCRLGPDRMRRVAMKRRGLCLHRTPQCSSMMRSARGRR
jgi:NAD(P)-dependent dehydrogenase (short-subunit alcohol dehydrogenase family)